MWDPFWGNTNDPFCALCVGWHTKKEIVAWPQWEKRLTHGFLVKMEGMCVMVAQPQNYWCVYCSESEQYTQCQTSSDLHALQKYSPTWIWCVISVWKVRMNWGVCQPLDTTGPGGASWFITTRIPVESQGIAVKKYLFLLLFNMPILVLYSTLSLLSPIYISVY